MIIGYYHSDFSFIIFFQVDPANIEGLKSRLEQKDKEICALKQAAKVRVSKKKCHRAYHSSWYCCQMQREQFWMSNYLNRELKNIFGTSHH